MTQLIIDNSKRSTYRQCKKKYQLQILFGYQPIFGSTALRAGSTYHAMQEGYHSWVKQNGWPRDPTSSMLAMTQGFELGKSIYEKATAEQEFFDDYKNFNTVTELFIAYLDHYKTDSDFVEIISTEQKFSCPMLPDNSLEEKLLSQLPELIFTGRLDLGLKMDGINWINDFKTTGWILDKVVSQANRSAQFIGYSYAGKRVLDFEAAGCLGNFAFMGATKSKVTGEYGKNRFDFKRVPQIYSQHDIDAWKIMFLTTARDIYNSMQEDIWPESFDACYDYGQCAYLKLCSQHSTVDKLNLDGFQVRFWDVLSED